MNMEASAFLVCEKGLDAEALLIPATRRLGCRQLADQIQGLGYPLAQQHRTMTGPYASRVTETSLSSISLPGWIHAPHTSRRTISPSHGAVVLMAVRHT